MAGLKSWSTTPSSNSDTPPNGWPESTMTVNQINDTGRQMMADIREWYEDQGWANMGETHTYASATTTTVASDVTSKYLANRRVRAVGSGTGTIYGKIVSAVYSAPNTTITYLWDSGSLSNETLAISLSFIASNAAVPAANPATSPTRQVFITGSGTYTTPTGATWIEVEIKGDGGGGGGSGDGNGGTGGTGSGTTFGPLTANGGNGGGGGVSSSTGALGGVGGTATGGDLNISGGGGDASGGTGANANPGGNGGGGGGGRGGNGTNAGTAGATNSGGGGGGAGQGTGTSPVAAAGGGEGGYTRKLVVTPASTYAYSVGAGGTAGTAGTGGAVGGAGAAGYVLVTEHYT